MTSEDERAWLKKVADFLVKVREEKKLSLGKIALAGDVDRTALYRFEKDYLDIRLTTLRPLAHAYQMNSLEEAVFAQLVLGIGGSIFGGPQKPRPWKEIFLSVAKLSCKEREKLLRDLQILPNSLAMEILSLSPQDRNQLLETLTLLDEVEKNKKSKPF